ncbi:MAG: threonine synthase [Pseudomonadota bacterium]|nr:threonine synthase [Pseudomonadota bacterium]
MKFTSTRGNDIAFNIDDVFVKGIANDGGLYFPDVLPRFELTQFNNDFTILDTAKILLTPFFEGSALIDSIDSIIDESLSFPIPCVRMSSEQNRWLLELFHGPTAAFKDIGARFLASCLSKLNNNQENPLVILVATSGDTGGAVASAFHKRPNTRVIVLFPKGKVSKRQEKQLTCWGDNILSLSVNGSFDSCQSLVKKIFADNSLSKKYRFSSANSINFGRLLPQSIYYAHTSVKHFKKTKIKPNFIVPTGNLGNGLACVMAKLMGFPVGRIILALNENRLIEDYLDGAEWKARSSIETLANAMDVGNASNMERLISIFGNVDNLKKTISAKSVSDKLIEEEIKNCHNTMSIVVCPHTATANYIYNDLGSCNKKDHWIIVATAHPAKFDDIVEPLIGRSVEIPSELELILNKPSQAHDIDPTMTDFINILSSKLD